MLSVFVHPIFTIAVVVLLLLENRNNTFENASTIPRELNIINHDFSTTEFKYTKAHYMQSPEWKHKRALVLARDNFQCRICSSPSNLQVHHLSYKNLYHEPLSDLATLCGDCHTAIHNKYGYPVTYQDYMSWQHHI